MTAQLVESFDEMRSLLRAEHRSEHRVGVVPTMGALHEGHLSLIRKARETTDFVVTTVFVNPTQFGPNEDFERYPRRLEEDHRLASSAGAHAVFAPKTEEMYPPGEQTRVVVRTISQGLCGAHRPGHFEGVTTVVSKLFHLLGEGTYFFGKKDFQQLRVIEAMARDLFFPVAIVGCPIVRESDGLAMSSRNAYLSPSARQQARALWEGLQAAWRSYQEGERKVQELLSLARAPIDASEFELEYLELRGRDQLEALEQISQGGSLVQPAVLLVAAELEGTRLIDNVVLEPGAPAQLGGVR